MIIYFLSDRGETYRPDENTPARSEAGNLFLLGACPEQARSVYLGVWIPGRVVAAPQEYTFKVKLSSHGMGRLALREVLEKALRVAEDEERDLEWDIDRL